MNSSVELPIDSIRLDPELQPRATIARSTWEHYMYLLGDGVKLPPVTVFHDGEIYWLADGYHRWHAHKALGDEQIEADLKDGSRRDAIGFMLRTNAKHGLPRDRGDYQQLYQTACRHGFVDDPADPTKVQQALDCSMRTAYDLTQAARDEIQKRRDEEKQRLNADLAEQKAKGKKNVEIALERGVHKSTIGRQVAALQAATAQPNPDGELAFAPEPIMESVAPLTGPVADQWWGAIRALQKIAQQPSVDELLASQISGLEHVFEPALTTAHVWINELHRKYFK